MLRLFRAGPHGTCRTCLTPGPSQSARGLPLLLPGGTCAKLRSSRLSPHIRLEPTAIPDRQPFSGSSQISHMNVAGSLARLYPLKTYAGNATHPCKRITRRMQSVLSLPKQFARREIRGVLPSWFYLPRVAIRDSTPGKWRNVRLSYMRCVLRAGSGRSIHLLALLAKC